MTGPGAERTQSYRGLTFLIIAATAYLTEYAAASSAFPVGLAPAVAPKPALVDASVPGWPSFPA